MQKELSFRTPLAKWLWAQGITQTKFATQIGFSRQRMSRLVRGEVSCGKKVAARISAATNGAVTEMDLLYPERIQRDRLTITLEL